MVDDPLTAVLSDGARRVLAQAIEAEVEAFLATMREVRLPDGCERLVRHGHGPERRVQTGIAPVAVQRAKLRDRGAGEAGADRIRFTSAILPRWARRTRSLDALLPILYLRGVSMSGEPLGSTCDFGEALAALLGRDAPNLSPSVVARLRAEWEADYMRRQRRDLKIARDPAGFCASSFAASAGPMSLHGRLAFQRSRASCMLQASGHARRRPVVTGQAPGGANGFQGREARRRSRAGRHAR